jgi:hypothetical protein
MINDFAKMVYEPINRCIYCGSFIDLTKEHIIPYSLGGKAFLPKASCKECAKITSRIELINKEIRNVRSKKNLKSRHPENYPHTQAITVETENGEEVIEIPFDEHPAILSMLEFDSPGYLKGRDNVLGINVIGAKFISYGEDLSELAKRHNWKSISVKLMNRGNDFARMLGKIAYTFTVGEIGYEAVKNSPIISSIFAKTNDIGTWVGTIDDIVSVQNGDPFKGILHYLSLNVIDESTYMVIIKLFANDNTPFYGIIIKV